MKRLLGMLLLLTVILVGCGAPVAALKKLGTKIHRNSQGEIVELHLSSTQVTDAGVAELKKAFLTTGVDRLPEIFTRNTLSIDLDKSHPFLLWRSWLGCDRFFQCLGRPRDLEESPNRSVSWIDVPLGSPIDSQSVASDEFLRRNCRPPIGEQEILATIGMSNRQIFWVRRFALMDDDTVQQFFFDHGPIVNVKSGRPAAVAPVRPDPCGKF